MTNRLSSDAESHPELFNPPERVLRRTYAIYLEGGMSAYEALYEAQDRAHVSDGLWLHCMSLFRHSWGRYRAFSTWEDSTLGMSRSAAKRFLKRAISLAARDCPNWPTPLKILDPGLNSEARV